MNEKISTSLNSILQAVSQGHLPDDNAALLLAEATDTAELMSIAATIRDAGFRNVVTYSRKVFIPLTHLCRDVCHYCTFAQTPKKIAAPYMTPEQVLAAVKEGEKRGCKEALFTLGEKPELRYNAARQALDEMGFSTTLEYVAHVAQLVMEQTGVLPHINAGCMTAEEIALLRPVSASMGIMLESASLRLCEKGMPHYGSPDKDPALRLKTIELAGQAKVPFTSGILIGIGETRRERIESLLSLRALQQRYGHIQEIIIQNFRAKDGTKMAQAPEPDLEDLLWTIAVARIIFGAGMSIQAPPNLSPGVLPQIINAGINDWGGVSPVTPDFVNPEAPWPHLQKLADETAQAGKFLQQRLTIYPDYVLAANQWLDKRLHTAVLRMIDAEGFSRTDDWVPGFDSELPTEVLQLLQHDVDPQDVSVEVKAIIAQAKQGEALTEQHIVRLFQSRGHDFAYVCQQADRLRQQVNGDKVAYVVTRNINYTNVCYFKCQFCAFSKGKLSENLRGRPYDLDHTEIARRVQEAWQRGATEVCMQGGIHPEYTGQTYLNILATVTATAAEMHIHAFSPLEVWQGAETIGLTIPVYLEKLKQAGLKSLPGTAAEILDDEVRAILCPDKINTEQWLSVMEAAHTVGLKSTATIMFGHVDKIYHWARHIIRVRELQKKTGGFTEFVPLPFVPTEAPVYLKGKSRKGPTFRESLLMHAVARIALHTHINNIQTSWVKMGERGAAVVLNAGANDLGGTLMNETITRAAGAEHGEEMHPRAMEKLIRTNQRIPYQRTTLYQVASQERSECAMNAVDIVAVINTPAGKHAQQGAPVIKPDKDLITSV
jgi:FO synthase